ncbi:MAG: tetratricopeptide repeat protein [Pirellulales bacterium]
MKRLLLPLAAVATLAMALARPSEAQTRRPTFAERPVPGARQAEVHNPASPRYLDFLPGGYDRRMANVGRNSPPVSTNSGGGSTWFGSVYNYGPWYPYGWPYGGYYGAAAVYGYGGLYGGDYGLYSYPPAYYYDYRYLPPVFVPAGTLYGPRALRDFLGLDPPAAPQGNAKARANAKQKAADGLFVEDGAGGKAADAGKPRATNAETRAQAWRFIGFGDKYFGAGKYSEAYQRYKKATVAAPDLAESFFRQAHALIALGRYPLAAKALQRGLALSPDWPGSGFRYDQLYGANQDDKAAHREALAKAAALDPLDADLAFLLGVVDYFDGRPQQARPWFQRAAELSVADASYLRGFLKRLVPPPPQAKEGLAEGER